MKKALIVILLLVLVGGYFFAGYSVYTQATLVECAVPEVDQNNRPDNFSLSDKDVFWDPSEYFVNDYEVVNIELSDESKPRKTYLELMPEAKSLMQAALGLGV